MATNEHGRPQSRGTKLQVPEIPRLAAETISSGAPGECFFLDSPFNRTNIRLLWRLVGACATAAGCGCATIRALRDPATIQRSLTRRKVSQRLTARRAAQPREEEEGIRGEPG